MLLGLQNSLHNKSLILTGALVEERVQHMKYI